MDLNQEVVPFPIDPVTSPREKQPYTEPKLIEWGSLVDLTKGSAIHTVTDADFSGTSVRES